MLYRYPRAKLIPSHTKLVTIYISEGEFLLGVKVAAKYRRTNRHRDKTILGVLGSQPIGGCHKCCLTSTFFVMTIARPKS